MEQCALGLVVFVLAKGDDEGLSGQLRVWGNEACGGCCGCGGRVGGEHMKTQSVLSQSPWCRSCTSRRAERTAHRPSRPRPPAEDTAQGVREDADRRAEARRELVE